jgi:DNA-binding transcriptional MerR regulator
VENVQLYLDCRLLQPARRRIGQGGGSAFYQEHIDRLGFIGRALAHGLSIGTVAQLLDDGRLLTCNDVYQIVTSQLQAHRRVRGSSDPLVAGLRKLVRTCGRTGGRKDCRILAELQRADAPPPA